MRYERVKIQRDTNTVHNRAMPPWEIPVVEFLFDDGNVEHLGVFEEIPDKGYPDAVTELDRLVRAYGADPKSGVPYANSVYGNARAGVRSLQKLIDDAKAADEEATPRVARKRKVRSTSDSLLN
jgi:hypothetical protein